MSNSLDQDLCLNCLQKLSSDDTSRQRVKMHLQISIEPRCRFLSEFKLFAFWVIFHTFCCLLIFSKSTFSRKKQLRNTFQVSVWIQIRPNLFVRPDLCLDCLQKLSAGDTSGRRVKMHLQITIEA